MKRITAIALVLVLSACDPQETPSAASAKKSVQTSSQSAVTSTAYKEDAGSLTIATNSALVSAIKRHLPGTAITTATGKYTYLVNSNGTVSPFASTALVAASGYTASMVVTVTAEELYCYGRGDQITSALPAPVGNRLMNGALVKEVGRTDTYVVSDGVAWPVITGQVFINAGYDFANVIELPAGTLASRVDAIGDCNFGIACLDSEYSLSCAQDEQDLVDDSIITSAATATATVAPALTQTAVATQTATASVPAPATATVSATATTSATSTTSTTVSVASSNPVATTTAVATQTATASATAPTIILESIDFTWVWDGMGTKLCLNPVYFAGGSKAVLLVWTGPDADQLKGPVTIQSETGFCWDFVNRQKGLYTFWADEPVSSCVADTCPRDAIPGNGAQYMTAPKASASAKKWLHCEPTGCDGMAYWDGTTLSPVGD